MIGTDFELAGLDVEAGCCGEHVIDEGWELVVVGRRVHCLEMVSFEDRKLDVTDDVVNS